MTSVEEHSLEISKQKEIFDELGNERRFEINKLSEGNDFNDLTDHYKVKRVAKQFICFKGSLTIYNDIKNGQISLQEEKKIQVEFQLVLNEIFKGNADHKSEDRKSAIKDIKKFYENQEKVIKFYNDYTRMVFGI